MPHLGAVAFGALLAAGAGRRRTRNGGGSDPNIPVIHLSSLDDDL